MTNTEQRITPAPIRRTLRVKAGQERAFDVFVGRMGDWWLKGHSLLKSPQTAVVIEPRTGGRWYEVGEDGSQCQWGKVIAWDRPHGVILAWQLTGEWKYDPDFVTEVEVSFRQDGEVTLVEFEHRDLERYGEVSAALRADMDRGWAEILIQFERLMAAPGTEG